MYRIASYMQHKVCRLNQVKHATNIEHAYTLHRSFTGPLGVSTVEIVGIWMNPIHDIAVLLYDIRDSNKVETECSDG